MVEFLGHIVLPVLQYLSLIMILGLVGMMVGLIVITTVLWERVFLTFALGMLLALGVTQLIIIL